MEPLEARRLVEARLGRAPQDMLEAAVALEAWGGLPAQGALDTAREVMRDASPVAEPSTGALPERAGERGALAEALAFLVAVIAIAGWAAPLVDAAGARAVERGVVVALPLTLALQWGLSCRWLAREHGSEQLGRHRAALALTAAGLTALGWVALGQAGLIAGLLTVTWVAGTVLARAGFAVAYAAGVVVTTALLLGGVAPLPVLLGAAAAALLAALVALRPRGGRARGTVGRWDRVATAGAIGGGTGLLLVGDPSVTWAEGAVPAAGLLPAAVAGCWGAYRMRDVGHLVAAAAAGVRVGTPAPAGLRAAPLRLLLRALAELALLAAGLSAALLLLTSALGDAERAAGVLTGFGLVAAATLLAGVLEALGRGRAVLAGLACALLAEAAVRVAGMPDIAGAGLVAGGLVATALLLPVAILVLGRPASTLATTLWIT